MPNNDREDLDRVKKRLDVVIRLFLEYQREKDSKITVGDQILLMEDAGLPPGEAGSILGIDATQVASYTRYAKNVELKKKVSRKK